MSQVQFFDWHINHVSNNNQRNWKRNFKIIFYAKIIKTDLLNNDLPNNTQNDITSMQNAIYD